VIRYIGFDRAERLLLLCRLSLSSSSNAREYRKSVPQQQSVYARDEASYRVTITALIDIDLYRIAIIPSHSDSKIRSIRESFEKFDRRSALICESAGY
jgi:hypothetical protein